MGYQNKENENTILNGEKISQNEMVLFTQLTRATCNADMGSTNSSSFGYCRS